MKEYKCMGCLTSFEAEYKEDCPSCGDDSDVIEVSAHTDKLSVEKLQEHLLPYKKEMVQKIIDEKMQLVTADEFVRLHKESLTAIREKDKLQEQLNTAKKALTEIAVIPTKFDDGGAGEIAVEIAHDALAAIGGDDEN
ncbi:hypothetical protein [Lactococcus lactis]|uniref:hypothetical protein n=1 Tax=Lactococcus lactis TaxID=1358 RepID=UPI002416D056|nr:hypothetical protein [Lactococcus lactis]MDG4970027.1 hypothetical protein [Lactococcus lactis]MDG5103885.1 hypothetical protein [Lactococcus lactis]